MHDETLGRTTNGPDVPTDQLTLEQLKALNITFEDTYKLVHYKSFKRPGILLLRT